MKFLSLNWCGLQWTPWIPFTSPDIETLPTGPGVYRIKAIGIDELFYIGQTGRNLRERLTALIRNTLDDPEHMPFNDPHTAAPRSGHGGMQRGATLPVLSLQSQLR